MNRLLVFGGTFDPVHCGHVVMFNAACQTLQPSRALLMPAGNPWQKGHMPFAAAADRLAMLERAFPGIAIDGRELVREGPTYTVETLAELAGEQPGVELQWLIGSDSFARLDSWHEAARLATLAVFAVVARAGAPLVHPRGAFRSSVVPCRPPAVSSTEIRRRIRDGQSIAGLAPDAVCDYIAEHHLYT
ncbi:MAG TPA: nicotinate (nicotinamide) nucleotide adenylyltransferase [Usitatibacteraceae bacterium]|nr:nicotinate (nicotinamide) nucleotide adenylyltransferase [Usitatibacteraceae bacterium]